MPRETMTARERWQAALRKEKPDRVPLDCGGYILGPCHIIQAVSPPENVVAMYEAAYDCGWY